MMKRLYGNRVLEERRCQELKHNKHESDNVIENFQNKKDVSKKVDDLLNTIHSAESILEGIREVDPDFDAGYKIDAGISRASAALEQYVEENKKFDFRDLKFEGYKRVDDVASSSTDVWFEREDNEDDSIHIYKPEFAQIDPLPINYYQYLVIVEILKGCEHYQTMVLDAKIWIEDLDNLGKEQNLKDMAEYILNQGFKDRKTEVYK